MKFLNICKHVWARVYLNVFAPDFTKESRLTKKAGLMEFFLPTTKRKQNVFHWLGQSQIRRIVDPEFSLLKAVFIVVLDVLLFFPRLIINLAKLVTEVLPDIIAQLFLWGSKTLKARYKDATGLEAVGCAIGLMITTLFTGLFKLIYFVGCCMTSPIATSIRAGSFNYKDPISELNLSYQFQLPFLSFLLSHVIVPLASFSCYLGILFLLANFVPVLGVLFTLSVGTLIGITAAYVVIDHVFSYLNRNPNGDDLMGPYLGKEDNQRYADIKDDYEQLPQNFLVRVNEAEGSSDEPEYTLQDGISVDLLPKENDFPVETTAYANKIYAKLVTGNKLGGVVEYHFLKNNNTIQKEHITLTKSFEEDEQGIKKVISEGLKDLLQPTFSAEIERTLTYTLN